MEERIMLGNNDAAEQSIKMILCNKKCAKTPEECPFLMFDTDRNSVTKIKDKQVFTRAVDSVRKRSSRVQTFNCECLDRQGSNIKKQDSVITLQQMYRLDRAGEEHESSHLWKGKSNHNEIRGAC